jgi:murein DD-endopeptidase MepM/ murein hydrolase activator NlpD
MTHQFIKYFITVILIVFMVNCTKNENKSFHNSSTNSGETILSMETNNEDIEFIYPLMKKGTVSLDFGALLIIDNVKTSNTGIDVIQRPGTPIVASAAGTVRLASWYGGFGYFVVIGHKSGYTTRYAHMMRFAPGIYESAKIKKGQTIGYVGTTGNSTGYHLYFDISKNGDFIDPKKFIKFN